MTEFDIRLVKSFVAVADDRSFTRAAERLHVAQPWLSVQIRKFEDQLGFRLFERNRNQAVVPSRQAEALLPVAREYLAAAERMAAGARRVRDGASAILRLGAPDFSAEMPMRTAIIDSFAAEHQEYELEVSNAWTVELLARVHEGELDIAFTVGPHADVSTEATAVARYGLALLGHANDLACLPSPLPLSAIAGRTVSIFRRNVNPGFHDAIARVLEGAGVTVGHLAESGASAIVHQTQRTGTFALIGDYTAASSLPEPLAKRLLAEPALAFSLNIVRRLGDRSPPVVALWSHAMRVIAT